MFQGLESLTDQTCCSKEVTLFCGLDSRDGDLTNFLSTSWGNSTWVNCPSTYALSSTYARTTRLQGWRLYRSNRITGVASSNHQLIMRRQGQEPLTEKWEDTALHFVEIFWLMAKCVNFQAYFPGHCKKVGWDSLLFGQC